jgi:glycosyltransferase involved in cell wall biosynthesis
MKGREPMRICVIAEGCYPYVVGGVSGWIDNLIRSFPNIEFVLLTVITDRSISGKFKFNIPDNVSEIHEVYLNDIDWTNRKESRRHHKLNRRYYNALCNLILNENVDWPAIIDMLQNRNYSLNDLLMGPDFMQAVTRCYEKKHSELVYSDFLWTVRSMYLPLFFVLQSDIPKADIYHCVATGYAGILGAMGKYLHHGKLLVSEHGIYTREREEELIKATWIQGIYKDLWIEQFHKMSHFAYDQADKVTSLYEHARTLQIELGCPVEKTIVTPNGIDQTKFVDIPTKEPADNFINIGAILRVTPIKDVKTMIMAFGYAKYRKPNLKLWIMGPCDEEKEYAKECFDLVENMQIKDVIFTDRINTTEYIGKMDFTILTSISEGQPLTILESYAAHKPVIATDVGNCKGLIYGEADDFGPAGILTHIMNVEEITNAIIELASDPEKCRIYGENGYKRMLSKYKIEDMKKTYRLLYQELAQSQNITWSDKPVSIIPETTGKHKQRRD